MSLQTPLDKAHELMQTSPDDVAKRMGFYARLADCELFLLLRAEASGDQINPDVFAVEGKEYVLVFDTEERMCEFVGGDAFHVALSGRGVAIMLAGQGLGLAVNLGVAPSSILIPSEALGWLGDALEATPQEASAKPTAFHAPTELPDSFLSVLDAKLANAKGLARQAILVMATYEGRRQGYMLAFIDAHPSTHAALAKSVSEAVVFGGGQDLALDVTFLNGDDPAYAALAKSGLCFDIPEPEKPSRAQIPPGSDPDSPPILR